MTANGVFDLWAHLLNEVSDQFAVTTLAISGRDCG
jgi:hypothetical protein